ncbi:MAG: thermonuclease family protein [Thiobacillus sp.]|nr:thermonuclease family protein [Thiobacillus sp.]
MRRVLCTSLASGVLFVSSAWSETIRGKVVAIADGDTITVLDAQRVQHKIRLAGIDAPEKKQAFGQRAKEHISALVFSRSVDVDAEKKDRYGRAVGKVMVDGQDVNLAMVVAGFAWHYKRYEREQSASDRQIYSRAEEDSRQARRGLWQDTDPMAPWDWRKASRNGKRLTGAQPHESSSMLEEP